MRRNKVVVYNVSSCSNCPGLWQNMEYPDSFCTLAQRSWGMGYFIHGDPIPDWCPLRTTEALIKLKEEKDGN